MYVSLNSLVGHQCSEDTERTLEQKVEMLVTQCSTVDMMCHMILTTSYFVFNVPELDQYIVDFKGGNFPLSIVTSYKNCSKKKGENSAWRKVNTSPRKKSVHSSGQLWNKKEENVEGKSWYK